MTAEPNSNTRQRRGPKKIFFTIFLIWIQVQITIEAAQVPTQTDPTISEDYQDDLPQPTYKQAVTDPPPTPTPFPTYEQINKRNILDILHNGLLKKLYNGEINTMERAQMCANMTKDARGKHQKKYREDDPNMKTDKPTSAGPASEHRLKTGARKFGLEKFKAIMRASDHPTDYDERLQKYALPPGLLTPLPL